MRLKWVAAVVAAGAVGVPMAQAGAPVDRATGGGQVLLGTQGAGNTIAFTAQGTAEAAKGQVQFIDRSAGRGRDQVKYHGVVECILVEGNYAEIAGRRKGTDGTQAGDVFTLRVVDNGEGAAAEDDMVFFDDVADDQRCARDDNDDDDAQVALARGNAQVHDADAPPAQRASRSQSFKKSLRLAGLR